MGQVFNLSSAITRFVYDIQGRAQAAGRWVGTWVVWPNRKQVENLFHFSQAKDKIMPGKIISEALPKEIILRKGLGRKGGTGF